MARDGYKSTELASGLPKLKEVIRTKHGRIKALAGNEDYVEIFWDLSAKCKEYQVFELRVGDRRVRLSRQAFEHYLRVV